MARKNRRTISQWRWNKITIYEKLKWIASFRYLNKIPATCEYLLFIQFSEMSKIYFTTFSKLQNAFIRLMRIRKCKLTICAFSNGFAVFHSHQKKCNHYYCIHSIFHSDAKAKTTDNNKKKWYTSNDQSKKRHIFWLITTDYSRFDFYGDGK